MGPPTRHPELRKAVRIFCTGATLAAVLGSAGATLPALAESETVLVFERDGATVATVSRARLGATCGLRRLSVDDPYYETQKHFLACPLAAVLESGFGADSAELAGEFFVLEALDGYSRPAAGEQLFEDGAFLALGEADGGVGHWQPIDRRQVDPGPFYLVWAGAGQSDPHRYPWPYQLAKIRIASLAQRYPHMRPEGLPDTHAAWDGLRLFQSQCLACHSINGDGGKVGPELNVPQSIVEYRPAAQIKAYIRNPETFRYTTMPAHPGLSTRDLNALLAYFQAMNSRKHDPVHADRISP